MKISDGNKCGYLLAKRGQHGSASQRKLTWNISVVH
jgi:hypothetical protein